MNKKWRVETEYDSEGWRASFDTKEEALDYAEGLMKQGLCMEVNNKFCYIKLKVDGDK